ncbi:MAG TPA: cell division protein FtsH [Candidatus Veblenbacteria bacterium]|uniref:ATP-dependent zinc metalloprotease FtsH n=5 Tax=Candidatus Vebleniibacteriota TaxID=1817921 RepID=A0A1G2Q7B1_9BACT|nr:MAG: ATP-dependent zinc metalloprotease FtsH [Parcubacteria group bacterium GW2011_GWA2_42_80]KKS93845.1 MAG: ATP-dependent zinc metalloprotease FtsH [Parcubacteria group bacterium GW2011_GWE2_43_12]KKT13459.1 MAG: ATP-dependent zinc metalloprotease FtsH [Parcubacteria group bacterium GW2011_GWA1_43_27]KKT15382.1 MAG: ATP-dependent zinc metalloprotease FtsH [Parcubacteria group bacterium GW2011_GWF2_43_38]KKT17565.1 MAG: ATP-dependent zinc metalloprotease FtsH [Parcubacteria group bacterium 
MRTIIKNFLIFFLVFLLLASLFSLYENGNSRTQQVSLDQIITSIENESITAIEVSGDELIASLNDGRIISAKKESGDSLTQLAANYGVDPAKLKKITVEIKEPSGLTFWLATLLPFLLPILLLIGFIYFMSRQIQGANTRALSFGQAKAKEVSFREKKNRVTFKEVAGVQEAKQELEEVVEFLKLPEKFLSLGARIPKGVLLLGPPGTGKTLLARAVAGEADVPFFHISGSEFVEMFVGVGASRVRDLFGRAKKAAPCIVFVDEIDAVGRQRGTGLGGSHDEREQTLNQILVEMDGFEANTNVIVMAATNRPDVLDPALLRPGRFDRQVILDLPDIKDRNAILSVHAKEKPLAEDVNLRVVAERTPGFSGADLANLLNEAAILAARRNQKKLTQVDCLEALEKVMLGPERKSHLLSEREKKITAYHEAGHALVAHFMPAADPVHKISIISRGRAGGYTLKLPTEDKHLHPKSEFEADLAVMLAGHAAEREIFGEVTTGAQSDLKRATRLARQLITEYGMSEKLGPRTFGLKEELIFLGREISEQRDYSEKIAQAIDDEVSHFLKTAYGEAQNIIKKQKAKLQLIADELIKKEVIERSEFEALMAN